MKKKIKKFPVLKKSIKDFLLDEEGKITKKDIAKIGVSLAALSFLFPSKTEAAGHTNNFNTAGPRGGHASSHASHSAHGSHASHCSGLHMSGW